MKQEFFKYILYFYIGKIMAVHYIELVFSSTLQKMAIRAQANDVDAGGEKSFQD